MSAVKAFPMVVIIFLVSVIFISINQVGQDSIDNTRLDNKSVDLILDINSNLNDNFVNLTLPSSNLTNGTSFEGQDPFVQQFLENKQNSNIFEQFMGKLISIPDLLILGVNEDIGQEELSIWKALIASFVVILIIVVGLVAIFGEGRFT